MIIITKLNEVFVRLQIDSASIKKEIEKLFSYKVPHYIPNKEYFKFLQSKDMKISLFNTSYHTLHIGLLPDLIQFLKESNYQYQMKGNFNSNNLSENEALEFIKSLNLPPKFIIRDYQLKYFIKCVRSQRVICHAPVNSGKTLIIYLLIRYFNQKTLITVPTTNLVYQLINDFKEFGFDTEENCHDVMAGQEKSTDKLITISTWQSLFRQEAKFFSDFRVVIGDEAQRNKAYSLVKIMELLVNTPVRIGFSGTIPDQPLYLKQIQGSFGPVVKYVTQDELIEKEFSSPILIKCICLHHNLDWEDEDKLEWEEERKYLLENEKRNEFIANLACSLKGNTFVMFTNIKHGKELLAKIKEKTDLPVHYVAGEVGVEEREKLRHTITQTQDSITLCSVVFATGVNIPNINNIIFTHPNKSKDRVLQSIGRGLRKHEDKLLLLLFDISDKLTEGWLNNVTYNQYLERLKIYRSEKFQYKEYNVNLGT